MREAFKKGLAHGVPICLGYISVSFAFGIFAVNSGLSVWESLFLSLTNVTSAGQFAAVPIMVGGGMLSELAVTQLVINMRYALMSISLSQKLDASVRPAERFAIAFGVTDEVFAVGSSQKGTVTTPYMLGLILTPVAGWTLGTFLGAVAGDILPAVITGSLGLAIYGMFIAIVMPVAKQERSVALCVLLAVAFSCAFYYLPVLKAVPSGFVIIICAVAAAAIMALAAPVSVEEEEVTADA